jgi:opacity protein-like surface antigen
MRSSLITAMLLITLPMLASAQGSSAKRAYSWEFSLSGIFQESKGIGSENSSSLQVDSVTGFGLNMAYNFSNKLALGVDLEYLQPKYEAVLVDENGLDDDIFINHKMSQFNGRIKGTYNFIDGPFTPFVEAGLGWSNFDSNVADGPPLVGCWWHPIWGYICDGYYRTFSDTLFSYGAGAGLRYEFVGGSFVKASYNLWELDGLGKASDSTFGAGRLEFGWKF